MRLSTGATSTPASTDVIACVNKKSAVMRQVANAKCGKTERILRLSTGAISTPNTGIAGPAGATGATGAAGPAGAAGGKGDTGAAGGKGDTGPSGTAGDAGGKGDTGAAGGKGDAGSTGAAGPSGTAGDAGSAGSTGSAGPAGAAGSAGSTGPTGARGVSGATGPAGSAGDDGKKGNTGAIGPAGSDGLTGAQGLVGSIGPTGATGPGTQWIICGDSFYNGLDRDRTIMEFGIFDVEGQIEMWKWGDTSYVLKMAASATELVFATVSKNGVEGPSTTYFFENSAFSQVGGVRTTSDVWNILVFSSDRMAAVPLKRQYIVKVRLEPEHFEVKAWETM